MSNNATDVTLEIMKGDTFFAEAWGARFKRDASYNSVFLR